MAVLLARLNHSVLFDWQQGALASSPSPLSLGWESQFQMLTHPHLILSSPLCFISDVCRISSLILELHGLVAHPWVMLRSRKSSVTLLALNKGESAEDQMHLGETSASCE